MKKDRLLQIRVDDDFLSKLEYLRKINGYKSIAETVRKTVEKEFRRENTTQKNGHWVEGKTYKEAIECNCSLCGQLMTTAKTVRMNYCPNCGAKMNG